MEQLIQQSYSTANRKDNTISTIANKLQGVGMDLPLSKFVKLNLAVFNEFKEAYVCIDDQVKIVEKAIGKQVSSNSLSVALSRVRAIGYDTNKQTIIIIEKKEASRFVSKDAKLILGTQVIKEQVFDKNGSPKGLKEITIDWRGLAPEESISSWILDYKDKLRAINKTGWRWPQIAEAINNHLSLTKKISGNTLTSIISIANNKARSNEQCSAKKQEV